MNALPRPAESEYGAYYRRYVDLVPDGNICDALRSQLGVTLALLQTVSQERERYAYAEGKWSIREVVGHMLDVERLMAFRALAIARSDGVDLPGMDQDEWARHSNADTRALGELAQEWAALRRANVHMFVAMDVDAGLRTGRASGNPFTVRTFPWIIAGHELWHRAGLERDYGLGAVGRSA